MTTHGIELSPGPAETARSKGHDVFVGTIEAFRDKHPELKFDAIFAQHVLEHVPDPHAFLDVAREMLAPGGKITICVPNFEARLRRVAPRTWGWYQVPVHLHHFSRRALEKLLGDSGFAIAESKTRGGDTLFLMLSAMQTLGLSANGTATHSPQRLAKTALRVLGEVTRPYYALGDDEIAVIATNAH